MKVIVSQMKITDDNIVFMSENNSANDLDLVDFLLKDMKEKDVAPADITKRTGLSASQVSKILNRESPAGQRALECFADALNLPVEVLYRYAGRFSKPPQHDTRRDELIHLYDQMTEENRDDTIDYARMKFGKQKDGKKNGKRDRVA